MHVESFIEEIFFKEPLAIAGRILVGQNVLRVNLHHKGRVAQSEAAGVFYRGESGPAMRQQVDAIAPRLADDLSAAWSVVQQMPAGGARNALDWCLWQLSAAQRQQPFYGPAFLPRVLPQTTMVTLGFGSPDAMADHARRHKAMKSLKLKLGGTADDAACVAAVRAARPDARLFVDANEGWTLDHLDNMFGPLLDSQVQMIEQPLPAASDHLLAAVRSPIPFAADESLQTLEDLERVAQLYHVANIKLDKCGGLSSALTLAFEARRRGLKVMVGCMGGRSLALLPAFIAAQFADLVDLDAPLLMASDTSLPAQYADATITYPEAAFHLPAVQRVATASPLPVRHAAS
ncbi:enolase C-terminal domain-like protein [Pseudoduganella sp.]|uniref:enolase C-terminal domain-like protein n=1 Tax=Pseudoduganella sp. TaxID=1880898 RepID=UPI0035B45939